MHPAGTFAATIEDHGFSKTSNGSAQFFTKFKTEVDTIVGYFSLSGGAAQYTVAKIKTMGFTGTDLNELTEGDVLLGNECEIVVSHKEHNGKIRAQVEWVNPKGGAPIKRLEKGTAISMFNDLLAATPAVEPPTGGVEEQPFH